MSMSLSLLSSQSSVCVRFESPSQEHSKTEKRKVKGEIADNISPHPIELQSRNDVFRVLEMRSHRHALFGHNTLVSRIIAYATDCIQYIVRIERVRPERRIDTYVRYGALIATRCGDLQIIKQDDNKDAFLPEDFIDPMYVAALFAPSAAANRSSPSTDLPAISLVKSFEFEEFREPFPNEQIDVNRLPLDEDFKEEAQLLEESHEKGPNPFPPRACVIKPEPEL